MHVEKQGGDREGAPLGRSAHPPLSYTAFRAPSRRSTGRLQRRPKRRCGWVGGGAGLEPPSPTQQHRGPWGAPPLQPKRSAACMQRALAGVTVWCVGCGVKGG
jgi:hypothetical protein